MDSLMHARLRAHRHCDSAERDSWARVKTGMYKDDLARVIDVDYSTSRATIEVVPRIDYAALASKERALPFGRTPAVRPAPRCDALKGHPLNGRYTL